MQMWLCPDLDMFQLCYSLIVIVIAGRWADHSDAVYAVWPANVIFIQ